MSRRRANGETARRRPYLRGLGTFLGVLAVLSVIGVVVVTSAPQHERDDGLGLRLLITSLLTAALIASLVTTHALTRNWWDDRKAQRRAPTRGLDPDDATDETDTRQPLTWRRALKWGLPIAGLIALLSFPLGRLFLGGLVLLLETISGPFYFEVVALLIGIGALTVLYLWGRRAPDLGPVDHEPSLHQVLPWAYDSLAVALVTPGRVHGTPGLPRRMRSVLAQALLTQGAAQDDVDTLIQALETGDRAALERRMPDPDDIDTVWAWFSDHPHGAGAAATPESLAKLLDKVRG